jgi:riboflavin kinase/FMN adenylyltransferase
MKRWFGLEAFPAPCEGACVTIGAFDGVHLGHQSLIAQTIDAGRLRGLQSVVFTFDRHPAELLRPSAAPRYITSSARRSRCIEALGVHHLISATFDAALRDMEPLTFVRRVLVEGLNAKCVVVGDGFRFGSGGAGDTGMLADLGASLGCELIVVAPVRFEGRIVSSTLVRAMVADGDVAGAAELLGRCYVLDGVVQEGDRIGRTIGFPTANLGPARRLLTPGDGIYAGWAQVRGRQVPAAVSIGVRPTLGSSRRLVEAHLLDFEDEIYGEAISLAFVAKLRDQQRFADLQALAQQIGADTVRARQLLAQSGPPPGF